MYGRVRATYHNGAFIPAVPITLPEETEVDLVIEPALAETAITSSTFITDPAERAQKLREIVERMQNNPIPSTAPLFTREELYDRC